MILHLSALQSGGAGIAALRLHRALLAAGEDSRCLTMGGAAHAASRIEILPKVYERFWQRGLHKMGIQVSAYRKWEKSRLRENLPSSALSGLNSDCKISNHPLVKEAEIIHLHWISGMFDWPDFFTNVRQPVVWTLHDMNPFLGVFHYEEDLKLSNQRARSFDAKLRQRKVELLAQVTNMICVSPSKWLSDKAGKSDALRHCEHHVIRNAIDTEVFKPYPMEFGREIFGLSKNKRVLLVVAEQLDNRRKGMDLLLDGLMKCELDESWEVVAVGHGTLDSNAQKIRHLGPLNDMRLLALLYSAADLFVIPSREDNFPNTILESLCCGTPAVGMPAGGIPEAIEEPRDGVIAAEVSSAGLADALTRASRLQFDRSVIRAQAENRFGGKQVAKKYSNLYEKIDPTELKSPSS